MTSFPQADALVLVAILPTPRDLEIARLLGWYRIPLRSAPKVVAVDFLAFYQTAAFGISDRWQISWFAAVRGHELTTRQDLFREEPSHPRAAEEYYKIQIGPLQELERPLLAGRWKRITFLYTTGAHFQSAETVNDLVVHSEEREVLWRSLRERALSSGQYQASELPEFALDPAILALLGGTWHAVGENKTGEVSGDW
jgi:hypothetical protein